MTVRVGLIGTFEVSNYGDLLFPLVAQNELGRRRSDVEFVWFGPVGGSSLNWPVIVGLGPLCSDRAARVSELCDAVVLGGGDLIRNSDVAVAPSYGMTEGDAQIWRPSAWFSSMHVVAGRGTTVLWNGVGVAEPVSDRDVTEGASYLSVRDHRSVSNLRRGASAEITVVPDTGFLLDRLFPTNKLSSIHQRLIEQYDLPHQDYVVLQASSGVAAALDFDVIDRATGGQDVVVVQTGPCHGDELTVELARRHFGSRVSALPIPATLEGIAAVIAGASWFLGNSLHGGITSLVYETPFCLFQFDSYSKRPGVLEVAGVSADHLVRDPASIPPSMLAHPAVWDRRGVLLALEQHFDRMSAMLPTRSTSNDLAWHDHPDILHLALERQPLPLVLGSDSPITPAQPPELPGGLRTVASVLAETRGERSALPDPAAPLLAELGRTRVTLDDFRDGVVQVRALKASLASAEAGWAEAIEHVRSLDTSLATAEAGWSETAERVRSLEGSLVIAKSQVAALDVDRHGLGRSLDALESQLIKRPGCWLTEVSGPQVTGEPIWPDYDTQYQSWLATSGGDRPVVAASSGGPTFSILTPVFNPSAHLLEACIRSVRAQSYPHWELVLLDVSDAPHVAAICRRFSEVDPRIRVVKHSNGGISTNTNLAAAEASGDWFVLLDHDDELANHALVAVAQAIEERSDVSYVYSDEDKIDESGNRSDPFFKPDWSPDLLRTVNYVTHLQAIRRDLWERIGGLRMEYDGAQDYDLALRASWEAGGALHVPAILYHWRIHDQSTAGDVTVKPYAHRAGRRALEDFTLRHLSGVSVEFGTGPTSHRLRYPVSVQKLSVIIPFRDNWHFTEACLSGIARTGTGLPLEVLLVDNQSSDPMTLARIDDWTARYDWARVVRYDEPFNFQQLNNWAVSQSSGDLLLFLNNDVEPIHEGWVEALAEHAQRSEVGAVGARLFYPDGLVQHAGVAVGIGGYADHPWKGLHPDAWTPAGPSYWTRNFLAVTAACLMIERAKFEAVGGFNERFVVGGGDVDLGLRLVEAGFWNVMTPWARLIHHESVTRGTSVPESDLIESRRVYGPYLAGGDPFYNRNLSLDGTDPAVKEG